MSHERLQLLAKLAKVRRYKTNEIIIREGDIANDVFIVRRGRCKVIKRLEVAGNPTLVEISRLYRCDVFGELGILLPGSMRTASVLAMDGYTETLSISKTTFFGTFGDQVHVMLGECFERYASKPELLIQLEQAQKWAKFSSHLSNRVVADSRVAKQQRQTLFTCGTKVIMRPSLHSRAKSTTLKMSEAASAGDLKFAPPLFPRSLSEAIYLQQLPPKQILPMRQLEDDDKRFVRLKRKGFSMGEGGLEGGTL